MNDVYLYVAGSSYVEQRTREYRMRRSGGSPLAPVAQRSGDREWVMLVAEDKPFISFVWLGVFLLMGGFSISILRHRNRLVQTQTVQTQTVQTQTVTAGHDQRPATDSRAAAQTKNDSDDA